MDATINPWWEGELAGGVFVDRRLGQRLRNLIERMAGAIGASLPLACQDWANTKAAYRFFSNDRVSEAQILAGHFQATRDRFAATDGPILVIQDTTEFTFQRERAEAVGITCRVNSGKDKAGRFRMHTVCGLLMHSSLALLACGDDGRSAIGPLGREVLVAAAVQGHRRAQAQGQSDARAHRDQGEHPLAGEPAPVHGLARCACPLRPHW